MVVVVMVVMVVLLGLLLGLLLLQLPLRLLLCSGPSLLPPSMSLQLGCAHGPAGLVHKSCACRNTTHAQNAQAR